MIRRTTARPPIRLFALLLACALICTPFGVAWGADRPNLLVIVADDLGYADMSFLERSPADVSTPGIDRLATSGTYFTDAYSTSPICSPSRLGLLTGRYHQRWGGYWYGQGGLPNEELTMAQALKALGYTTHKIGKTHLNGGPAEHPLDHGFDTYLGFIHHTWDYIRLSQKDLDAYEKRADGKGLGILNVGPMIRQRDTPASYEDGFTTEIFTDEAVKFIHAAKERDKPFYIELEHNAVHMPTYIAHPEYARKAGYEQPVWDRDADRWEFPFWDPRDISWNDWHKNWGHLGKVDALGRKRYIANLMALDDSTKRLLRELEKTGQRDNTIVVFLSDNGGTINTYSNNTPLRGYKYMFGEGGIRIPLIVSWPGKLKQGQRVGGLASGMDVFPTVLELLGEERPSNLDGRSLVPRLTGEKSVSPHDHLCWADGKGAWVVRQGPWKLIHSSGWVHENYKLNDKGIAEPAPDYVYPEGTRLFNLAQDISEQNDLSAKRPQLVKAMTELYEAWQSQMGKPRSGKVKKK
ncbi:MAG: sulfatase family protein [Planctomycetota bacterium]|jgi:arylsulfatase A-like enzyme